MKINNQQINILSLPWEAVTILMEFKQRQFLMRERNESIMKEVAFWWGLEMLISLRNNEIGRKRWIREMKEQTHRPLCGKVEQIFRDLQVYLWNWLISRNLPSTTLTISMINSHSEMMWADHHSLHEAELECCPRIPVLNHH